jgi:hypothetical protein
MLVLLINFPNLVTLGSLLVVQAFSSSSSVCSVIDLNLYILNVLLFLPTLICEKITGPLEDSLIIIATISMGRAHIINPTNEPMMSTILLLIQLNVLLRGTFLIFITGRPYKSSV